ncbi:MAG: hypothetical protein ACI97K_002257 [Glaciecola sp.]|jgi:hypothetical protein
MKFRSKVRNWLNIQFSKIKPGHNAIKGASVSLLLFTGLLFLIFAFMLTFDSNDPWIFLVFVTIAIISVLSAYLSIWLIGKIHSIPKSLKVSLLIASPLLFFTLAFEGLYWFAAILIFSLLGGAINVIWKDDFMSLTIPKKVVVVCSLLISCSGLLFATLAYMPIGFESRPAINAAAINANKVANIEAASPAEKGQFEIGMLTYGSGKDKYRDVFAENVTIKTDSVNGLAFLDGWQGFSGWYREQYWGFDDKNLPLNAYVWYPKGEGPFPLVLMVHGNHSMQDYSDDGYAYLGELLASRGFIFASVDQNFINASWSDIGGGLDEENDARGWLLLEHLRLWHLWNSDETSSFFNKVDIQKIALIGHSRGGEAVAHAALLNQMSAYYDDATIAFDYNFNIESIIAIAPVDGQYEPGDAKTSLTDINYFVIHGSQDADVSSFLGAKQYERIDFSPDTDFFKSGVYVVGANHGQFNSGWGDNDTGFSFTKFLNNKPLLPELEQRQIAKVYISAFLEATLNQKYIYRPLFVDHRKGQSWLPDTIYVNQYEDASFLPIATFDEDFNVNTNLVKNGNISAHNVSIWREQEIRMKWGEKGTRAAVIGWFSDEDGDDHGDDDSESQVGQQGMDQDSEQVITENIEASFVIDYSPELIEADSNSILVFSLAESTESANPKASGKWLLNANESNSGNHSANTNTSNKEENAANIIEKNNSETNSSENKEDDGSEDEKAKQPLDFTIELEDTAGQKAVFSLSEFSALQREIKTQIWKVQFVFDATESEMIFQTFSYPMAKIKAHNPDFDVSQITRIRFLFNKSREGVIVLDNLGIMRPVMAL